MLAKDVHDGLPFFPETYLRLPCWNPRSLRVAAGVLYFLPSPSSCTVKKNERKVMWEMLALALILIVIFKSDGEM